MDKLDFKILNLMQEGIPITETPFHQLAETLGINPEELIERLNRIKAEGYIRRTGAVFNTSKMGYKSILIGMEVPEYKVREVAEIINSYDGVTHNYSRNNRMNIWFTLSTKNEEERRLILRDISQKSGVDRICEFPNRRLFKLRVYFNMGED